MNKNKIVLIIVFSFMMFAIIFGASYSYFAAQGVGSGDDRQVTTTVGELKLTYADGSEYLTTNGDWEPGDYLTKTFTVTNNSSSTAYYRIYMSDVVNTFVMQKKDENGNTISNAPYELIYTLKKNDAVVINESSNTPVLSNSGLIYGSEGLGLEIQKGATDTYELTIKFIDTGENQNYNQAKLFRTKISIEEPNDLYYMFTSMVEARDDVAYDDYGNIRFVGKEAKNYITFNNEDWRVVGLFKDVEEVKENDTTEKHYMLKIVRNGTLGNIQWDSDNQNDWTKATLMNKLNGDYLNGGETYTSTSTIKSLANVSDYIAKVRWNIGGHNTEAITPQAIYPKERGTLGGGYNKDATTWDGKVALIYPSDYGYSVKGNDNTENANNCLNTNMNTWHSNRCAAQTWFHNGAHQWLLTPWSGTATHVFFVHIGGYLYSPGANNDNISVRPAVYLKSDIRLTGTGEQGANIFRILNTGQF